MLVRHAGDFRAIDGQHLSNLLPYLADALHSGLAIETDRAQAALDRRMCSDLGAGWVLFSASGQVSHMATGLAARLDALAGLRMSTDGRFLVPPAIAQTLRDALNALEISGQGSHVIPLSATPPVHMVLTVEQHAGAAQLVGRMRYDQLARDLPLTQVMDVFGVSRSEARLAVALCDGMTLTAAAQTLGWTLETARSTSKRLFARMGATGQPGVVRAMQSSAIWLTTETNVP